MDKETILDYATTTPENTNRNVLGSMVDSLLRENSGSEKVLLYSNGTQYADLTEEEIAELIPEGVGFMGSGTEFYTLSSTQGGSYLSYDEIRTIVTTKEPSDIIIVMVGDNGYGGTYEEHAPAIVTATEGEASNDLIASIRTYGTEFIYPERMRFGYILEPWSI